MTTTVHLRGGGAGGARRGRHVPGRPARRRFRIPTVAGRWTLDSFSESLDGFRFFAGLPEDNAAYDYRRWAWESAALDLALGRRARRSRDAVGRVARPVHYVVSTRVTNVRAAARALSRRSLQARPGSDWSDETIDRLAALGRVDTADFKGVYRGSFGQPPNPALHADRGSVPEPGSRIPDSTTRPTRCCVRTGTGSRGTRRSTRSQTWRRCRSRRAA